MKKVILPAVAIVGLLAMSFTAPSSSKMKLVKTENGVHLTHPELLSNQDLKTLNEMTVNGVFITLFFHQSATKQKIKETLVYHKGTSKTVDPTDPTTKGLMNILAKY